MCHAHIIACGFHIVPFPLRPKNMNWGLVNIILAILSHLSITDDYIITKLSILLTFRLILYSAGVILLIPLQLCWSTPCMMSIISVGVSSCRFLLRPTKKLVMNVTISLLSASSGIPHSLILLSLTWTHWVRCSVFQPCVHLLPFSKF